MGGNVVASHSWSSSPLPEVFRFSPRPNQAHKINWRPWGNEAFREAICLDKPIFFVISSSWCQWCHIMDETTLSEPSIITIVNNDYIPIRVDSDLRPDINLRYNQKGWPSVVLLSSEGEILWGGVYVPPTQMLYYLGHIRRYYSEHRQEIAEQARMLQERRFAHKLSSATTHSFYQVERAVLEASPVQVGTVLRDLYDEDYGGFTIHPHLKFSHPEALELLLQLSQYNQPDALDLVSYSLGQMRDGGLWDEEEGGFFRYSAASDWSTPHTEKMLEENAAMLRLVLLTAQASGEQEWYDLARRLLLYLNSALWQQDKGIFSGSQSADEEYYEPGPYSRASHKPPHVDKTVYTAWNARVISSYLLAAQVLNYPSLDTMAIRALDYLCKHMMHHEGSVCHYAVDESVGLPGQLADQVWMIRALLDAYELHQDEHYLETAMILVHYICQALFDQRTGLFYDSPEGPHTLGLLALREQPLTENAIAAECLLRLSLSKERHDFYDMGLQVLLSCFQKHHPTGIQGSMYASIVLRAIDAQWL